MQGVSDLRKFGLFFLFLNHVINTHIFLKINIVFIIADVLKTQHVENILAGLQLLLYRKNQRIQSSKLKMKSSV